MYLLLFSFLKTATRREGWVTWKFFPLLILIMIWTEERSESQLLLIALWLQHFHLLSSLQAVMKMCCLLKAYDKGAIFCWGYLIKITTWPKLDSFIALVAQTFFFKVLIVMSHLSVCQEMDRNPADLNSYCSFVAFFFRL